jgi:hypothetical protein
MISDPLRVVPEGRLLTDTPSRLITSEANWATVMFLGDWVLEEEAITSVPSGTAGVEKL